MSREFKFRVWDAEYKDWIKPGTAGVSDGGVPILYHEGGILGPLWRLMDEECHVGRFVTEQWTSLTDRNGVEIYEGDIILVAPIEFEKVLLNPNDVATGGVPIFEVFEDKPLPAADLVYARGVVIWSEYWGQYRCEYVWQCDSWKECGGSSNCLIMNQYNYEVIGNVHQNPDLLV